MSNYDDILADLKAHFGPKKQLTSSDIAPVIGRSVKAQNNLRQRDGGFPLAKKDPSGRYVVSIYDLARFIDDPESFNPQPRKAVKPIAATKARKASAPTSDTSNKPTRRPPSLGATLRAFAQAIAAEQTQLDFKKELFAALEAHELDRSIKTTTKRKKPRP